MFLKWIACQMQTIVSIKKIFGDWPIKKGLRWLVNLNLAAENVLDATSKVKRKVKEKEVLWHHNVASTKHSGNITKSKPGCWTLFVPLFRHVSLSWHLPLAQDLLARDSLSLRCFFILWLKASLFPYVWYISHNSDSCFCTSPFPCTLTEVVLHPCYPQVW